MRRVAVDTETYLIAPGRLAPRLVCMSTAEVGEKARLLAREDAVGEFDRLLDSDAELVFANAPYDLAVFAEAHAPTREDRGAFVKKVFRALDEGRIVDILVREKLRKIALDRFEFCPILHRKPRFNLKELVLEWLGIEMAGKNEPDAWRLRYHDLDGVPVVRYPEEAARYALHDAELTLRVDLAQRADGSTFLAGAPWPDEQRQYKAAWALHLMAAWGVRAHPGRTQKLRERYEADLRALDAELAGSGVVRPDGSKSNKEIQRRVVESFGGEARAPRTKKSDKFPDGQISISRDVLEVCADPVLKVLARRSRIEKYLSTFIPKLEQAARGVATPDYGVLVRSGRTGGAGGEDDKKSWQQLPRKGGIRECVIPREGWVFGLADYAIAELRALAQVCIDFFTFSKLGDVIRSGRDPHFNTAAEIRSLGGAACSYEMIEAESQVEGEDAASKALRAKAKDDRQSAKPINFGLPGGLGAKTLVIYAREQYGVVLTLEEASKIKPAWIRTYPEMELYFQRVGDRVGRSSRGAVVQQVRSGRLRGGCTFCPAANTYFQGLTGDFSKEALYEVTRACYGAAPDGEADPLFGSRPVLFTHDEINAEHPKDRAAEAVTRMAGIMVEVEERWLPDVGGKSDPVLATCLSKDAKAVFGADGRLVPWSPKED